MHRILVSPKAIQDDTITITDPSTLHHLCDVLRLKAGERVECLDGQGSRYTGLVTEIGRQELVVDIERRMQEPLPFLQITLAQSLIKPSHFEWAIQKATELGVSRIVPLLTARTTVKSSPDGVEHRVIRWKRIVEEAMAQSGLARVPRMESPQPFESFVKGLGGQLVLIPTLVGETKTLSQQCHDVRQGTQVTVLIGPEGDFSPEEVAFATRYGARPVRLGPLTLRSETAAVVALALLQQQAV